MLARARGFLSGFAVAAGAASAAFLAADAASDVVTLSAAQAAVLPLASGHAGLCSELGAPLAPGGYWVVAVRASPTGRLAQVRSRFLPATSHCAAAGDSWPPRGVQKLRPMRAHAPTPGAVRSHFGELWAG